MKFLIIFASLFSLTIAALPARHDHLAPQGRIHEGHLAAAGQFPYMVWLEMQSPLVTDWCGGALIGQDWVVTSAHCFRRFRTLIVYLGLIDVEDAAVAYPVPRPWVTLHPDWDSGDSESDIALVRIPTTEFCDNISPIALPPLLPSSSTYPSYSGEEAIISGWGSLDNNDVPFTQYLRWARVTVFPNTDCAPFYSPAVRDEELCTVGAGSSAAGPCSGDSGGPLVSQSRNVLIGISMAVTDEGCESGNPALYVRVSSHLQWIKSVTGISYQN